MTFDSAEKPPLLETTFGAMAKGDLAKKKIAW